MGSNVKFNDIYETMRKFHDNHDVKIHAYTPLFPVLQVGPTCGLACVAMLLRVNELNEIFDYAKRLELTEMGDMFSADNLSIICRKFINCERVEIHCGRIDCNEIVTFLKNGGIMLVPYDADKNNGPCLANGTRAHWTTVCGIVEVADAFKVTARQGKSKHLALFDLTALSLSNLQLTTVGEKFDGKVLIPLGGIDGARGICGRSILIYNYSTC